MLQYLRSLLFILQATLAMAVLGILFFPGAIFSPRVARFACGAYARYVLWSARWMVGLKSELRGEVPQGEVLVAAKHQSFLDILILFDALPRAKFIMKRELLWAPFIGIYAWRLGCVPVNRGKRAQAISQMMRDVEKGRAEPGQLVIYPQGTRVAPGASRPYKVGVSSLYKQMQQPCVPAATNAGLFWPRRGILRKPGLAVVEFLPIVAPGMAQKPFMDHLEQVTEDASDALMAEAGFRGERRVAPGDRGAAS